MNREELTDLIAEALDDSMGPEWNTRLGARYVNNAVLVVLEGTFKDGLRHGSAVAGAPIAEPTLSAAWTEYQREQERNPRIDWIAGNLERPENNYDYR